MILYKKQYLYLQANTEVDKQNHYLYLEEKGNEKKMVDFISSCVMDYIIWFDNLLFFIR